MMEIGTLLTVTNLVLVVAGVAVGLLVGRFTSPALAEATRLRSELERTLRDHESYKASVNSHFRKTADLVGQMTKSYAAVYDHLATGARRFCDEGEAGAQVPFGPLPGALSSPVIEGSAEEVAPGQAPAAAAEPVEDAAEAPDAADADAAAADGADGAEASAAAGDGSEAGAAAGDGAEAGDAAAGDAGPGDAEAGGWPTDVALDEASTGEVEEDDSTDPSKPSAFGSPS